MAKHYHHSSRGVKMKGGHDAPSMSLSKGKLNEAMREVFSDEPSTVKRAKVKGKKKRSMMIAIAFSKARARGARLPKK